MADSSLDYQRGAPERADTSRQHQQRETTEARRRDRDAEPGAGILEGHWSGGRLVLLASGWLAAAVVLGALSVAAHTTSTFPVDPPIAGTVQRLNATWLGSLIELGGNANWPLPAIIGLVVIFAALLVMRLFRAALCTALAGFGADLLNLALNTVVARPRPQGIHIPTLGGLGSHSFPSGHVAHTLGLYGFLFYLCWRAQRTPAGRRWRGWLIAVQAVAAVFILTVGPSRILEREHWPSDVLGGYLVGVLTLVAAIALYHWLTLRKGSHPRASFEINR